MVDDPYCRTTERVTATVGHVTMGLLCFCLTGRPAQAESLPAESMPTDEQISVQVYLSEPQARTRIFPDATHFERRVHMIDSTARTEISERLGHRVVDDSFAVYIARGAKEELLGLRGTHRRSRKVPAHHFHGGRWRGSEHPGSGCARVP